MSAVRPVCFEHWPSEPQRGASSPFPATGRAQRRRRPASTGGRGRARPAHSARRRRLHTVQARVEARLAAVAERLVLLQPRELLLEVGEAHLVVLLHRALVPEHHVPLAHLLVEPELGRAAGDGGALQEDEAAVRRDAERERRDGDPHAVLRNEGGGVDGVVHEGRGAVADILVDQGHPHHECPQHVPQGLLVEARRTLPAGQHDRLRGPAGAPARLLGPGGGRRAAQVLRGVRAHRAQTQVPAEEAPPQCHGLLGHAVGETIFGRPARRRRSARRGRGRGRGPLTLAAVRS
mmetsp:Transcript_57660/g.162570  ORF Transcript_57660/g.162570 Transcript_57660/m.162570 type:complete len:292 (+) Transcript_57660:26-901(+)